jgi:hypothetical protein
MSAGFDCLDRKRSVFAHGSTTYPLADDTRSCRNRRHNRARFVVELQCAVPNAPSAQRNSSRDASNTDDVWRGSFHGAERDPMQLHAAGSDDTPSQSASRDNQ